MCPIFLDVNVSFRGRMDWKKGHCNPAWTDLSHYPYVHTVISRRKISNFITSVLLQQQKQKRPEPAEIVNKLQLALWVVLPYIGRPDSAKIDD